MANVLSDLLGGVAVGPLSALVKDSGYIFRRDGGVFSSALLDAIVVIGWDICLGKVSGDSRLYIAEEAEDDADEE